MCEFTADILKYMDDGHPPPSSSPVNIITPQILPSGASTPKYDTLMGPRATLLWAMYCCAGGLRRIIGSNTQLQWQRPSQQAATRGWCGVGWGGGGNGVGWGGGDLVSEKEHGGAGVVQLVHGVEVRHLADVHQVHHRKVLARLRHAGQDLRQAGLALTPGSASLLTVLFQLMYNFESQTPDA